MPSKPDLTHLGERLADLGSRFEEKVSPRPGEDASSKGQGLFRTLNWNLKDLFTQGVNRHAIRDMVRRDVRDTFRFFVRDMDFNALQPLPWYKRYLATAWKFFLVLAYRLSPPRRIAFAVAIFALLLGWLPVIAVNSDERGTRISLFGNPGGTYWLLSVFIFISLLFMELKDKLDLKSDLEIAREIQFGLIPLKPFEQDEISIRCNMRPANTVGGDYCDIVHLEDHQVVVVIGDVAGKGMPAALLMALLQGSLRTLITAGLRGSELITKLNQYLCTSIPSNSLITLFYGELNTVTGVLRFVNAGHNAPFVIRKQGALERLHSNSVVMGVLENPIFSESEVRVDSGDELLLFTDGITEAFNLAQEEYGEDRLGTFLQRNSKLSQEQLIQGLLQDVLAFCKDVKPTDDMTIMSARRKD
jgi:sigma-B regulation protein RsbU (phosphoserine phosphatase)